MKRTLILITLLGLTVAACGDDETVGSEGPGEPADAGDGGTAVDPFGDTTWELTSGTVDGEDLVLVDGAPVTLTVTDGQAAGRSACNNYFGELVVDGSSVTPGVFGSTEMACMEDGVMELEAAYLGAMQTVTGVAVEGEELVLTGEGVELRFAAQPEVPDAELAGTDWTLMSLLSNDAVSSTYLEADEATLRIEDDGSASGSTGCNRFTGSFEVVDGVLTTDGLGTTRMACAGDVWMQEDHVLAVLQGGPTIEIEGAMLTLMIEDGRGLQYTTGS
jgi:heat shock protein HslJ